MHVPLADDDGPQDGITRDSKTTIGIPLSVAGAKEEEEEEEEKSPAGGGVSGGGGEILKTTTVDVEQGFAAGKMLVF